jgi:hypothetical protein
VLAETGVFHNGEITECGGDDLGRLSGSGVLAANQDIGLDFAADEPAITQPFCLLATQIGETRAGPRTSYDPGHRGLRFSMADEHKSGHSAPILLFVRARRAVRLDPLASEMCAECKG